MVLSIMPIPRSAGCRRRRERAPGLLSANIERIDDLGRVRFARVRIGDAKFAARIPPGFSIQGEVAGLIFDPSHVHVYADSLLVEGVA